jgi:hypothetical protein
MPYPQQLGQPCWDGLQVGNVISVNAQTNTQSADYFLAAHSPFRFITDFRNQGPELSEEEVFQRIFAAERSEVLAAIKGEPGTGKSHLVHWLKLRADWQVQSGDERFKDTVRVLVQRGNGSLKDTLRQMVEQLERVGIDLHEELGRVRDAMERLSPQRARVELLAELALEIGTRWRDRGRAPLPRGLRHLPQALKSSGISRWLLREGGVLDQVVERLTQNVALQDRDTFPAFDAPELNPRREFRNTRENSEEVVNFFEDLDMERGWRNEAVKALNIGLRDAVSAMTGLGGSNLQEVFLDIRRKLGRKRTLALFIEDVSVTGFDRDVVNALVPQTRDDIGPMIAVIGITSNAWGVLEQNQIQRVTPVFEIGSAMTQRWANEPEELARFTARYLNAIRMNDAEIRDVAHARRDGDVTFSKCTQCPVREPCHAAFDSVTLGDSVVIGMFPFSPRAPHALLAHLRESADTTGVARSQRGLLENILRPVLEDSRAALEGGSFPHPESIPLQPGSVIAWAAFVNGFLGGAAWDESRRRRVQMLAEFWAVPARSAGELAASLEPFLEPLGFPPFSQTPAAPRPPVGDGGKTPVTPPGTPLPISAELKRLLANLEAWRRGERKLDRDEKFREVLAGFFKQSIAWQDEFGATIDEVARRAPVGSKSFPYITDQIAAAPNNRFYYTLPHNDLTAQLLAALLRFKHLGKNSWDYDNAELDKREVSRWLRKHRSEIVASTFPEPPLDRIAAVRVATQALGVIAMLRDHRNLADEPDAAIAQILSDPWEAAKAPTAFSSEMRDLIEDLRLRHRDLVELIQREVGAGQGDTPPQDFIDPRPLLEALRGTRAQPAIESVPAGLAQGNWKTRFDASARLVSGDAFSRALVVEKKTLGEKIEEVRTIIRECGLDCTDLRTGFEQWLTLFLEVMELQQGTRHRKPLLPYPDDAFDRLWREGIFRHSGDVWTTALSRGADLADAQEQNIPQLLIFDPSRLEELCQVMGVAQRHLNLILEEIAQREQAYAQAGAGSCDALLSQLQSFPGALQPLEPTACT